MINSATIHLHGTGPVITCLSCLGSYALVILFSVCNKIKLEMYTVALAILVTIYSSYTIQENGKQ